MRRLLPFFLVAAITALLPIRPAGAQDYLTADEARVYAMVNATRAQHGLAPLDRVEELVTLARGQSARMSQQGSLFHNPALKAGLDALGLDWHWSGENVGVGPDVDAIDEAFLGSTHHYENIVRGNYTAIGIGVVAAKTSGYIYVTQVFAELGSARPNLPDPPAAPTPEVATPAPPPTPEPTIAPKTPIPAPRPLDPVVIEGGVVAPGRTFVPATEESVSLLGQVTGLLGLIFRNAPTA